jgi:hypothetical protein
MVQAADLGQWWPEVSKRVAAGLARRGVPAADIADVVQETAARALAHPPQVASADELARWAFTVATRITIDGHRRTGRVQLVPLDDDSPQAPDVATIVEGRIRWQKTMRALSLLSGADRAALAASLWPTAPTVADAGRRQAVRDAVRLHRARTRLTAMVARLGIVLGALWRGLRRRTRFLKPQLAAAVVVVLLVLLGVAQPAGITSAGADARPAPAAGPSSQTALDASAPSPAASSSPAASAALGTPDAAGPLAAASIDAGTDNAVPSPDDTIDPGPGPGPDPGTGLPFDGLNIQTGPSDVETRPANRQLSDTTDCDTGKVPGPGCLRAYTSEPAL